MKSSTPVDIAPHTPTSPSSEETKLSSSPDWLSRPRVPFASVSPRMGVSPGLSDVAFKANNSPGSSRRNIEKGNYTRTFFQPLLVGDQFERQEALDELVSLLESTLADEEACRSPSSLLQVHLGTIVLLSTECPFPEIRTALQSFLQMLREEVRALPSSPLASVLTPTRAQGIDIPQPSRGFSSFFSHTESPLPYLLSDGGVGEEVVARLCQFAFLHRGRVSHLVQLLAWHPTYLDRFYQTYDHLMYDSGPLPNDWVAYIAIMAASRHFCDYLIDAQKNEFLELDGDERWLEGIQYAPAKIAALYKINAILAHQPWRLESSHIAELCGSGCSDSWSIGELIHALLVMTTFHSLSGIVWGCGLLPEVLTSLNIPDANPRTAAEETHASADSTMQLLEALAIIEEGSAENSPISANLFETVDTTRAAPTANKKSAKRKSLYRYRGAYELAHEDFVINSNQYSMFHFSDFSWKEQGYPMVNEYYPSCTGYLDDEFRTIYNLTYRTFSKSSDIDTGRFRMAVWHYVHRVQGVYHDDYSYEKVNFWLNIRLKKYIKKLVCYPHEMEKEDFLYMGLDLTPQEKVHLSLLATEARKQAALLYGLQAIMKYQAEASRSK